MDYVADLMRDLGAAAAKAGVTLGLENTNSAADNAKILERCGSPAVKVYYDVGNSTNGGFDVVKEIAWLGAERICQFHLKDNPHYLGEGKIPFPEVMRTIASLGYRGFANFETDSPSGSVSDDLRRNYEFIRKLMKTG
jgi:sugar phosphate isomerase/epimerase